MAINVIRFEYQGTTQWGVTRDGTITVVEGTFSTTADFLRHNNVASLSTIAGPTLDEASVSVLSPVTRNQQFVCQGANYRSHMIESGMKPEQKSFNMIFRKASSCIVPASSDVMRPRHVSLLDYEVELGLVLGADLTAPTTIREADLHRYVAGIVIVNDYSARDVQIPQTQFYKGKSYRTFGPVGPYLCLLTPSELAVLRSLRLRLTVNGEVRQDGNTADLVFPPADTLTELSGVQDLFVGDLLATGTPAGCALRVPPPIVQKVGALLSDRARFAMFVRGQRKRHQYLKPGDVVEARIQSADGKIDLGVQRNRVVEEPAA